MPRTRQEIDSTIADMKKRYKLTHCSCKVEEAKGEEIFVVFEVRFKIKNGKKTLDISRQ